MVGFIVLKKESTYICATCEVYERNEKLYLSSCCRPYGRYLGADFISTKVLIGHGLFRRKYSCSFPDSLYGHLAYFSRKLFADNGKMNFGCF